MTFHFWKRLSSLLFYSVSGNANSMVNTESMALTFRQIMRSNASWQG
jgi:hypothetical protein